jgi:hypothetical protein
VEQPKLLTKTRKVPHRVTLNALTSNKNIRVAGRRNLQKSDRESAQALKSLGQTYLHHIYIILYRSISPAPLSDVCAEGDELKLITLYVPETYLKALDQLVGERFYPNRAEAIRVAIRDLINDELWRRIQVG